MHPARGQEAGPSVYRCSTPGCTKSFTRKDHLIRHAANHTTASFYCPVCKRPFKRLDLLQRHERRNICQEESYHMKRRRTSSFSPSDPPSSGFELSPPPIPVPPPDPTPAPVPDFMVSTTTDWGFGLWPPDPWEGLLHEALAPPFNEPALNFDMTWSNPLTPRMQESAERGGESSVSPALLTRLLLAYPDVDINLPFLIDALGHYWSDVAPSFPFIHHGTLSLDNAPSELVLMMAITGSVHMTPRSDFRSVVQRVRGTLVQDCGLDMPISTLQAFCLAHVHDTWYGGAESLFVAQCMWPIMVAHSRKKGIGVVGRPETEAEEEEAWAAWAKDEERRRAAFCVLLIDTHISAFWNQHPSRQLSIFAHNITLPCTRTQWDAPTASEWFRVREPPPPPPVKKPRSSYLPGLNPEFQVSVVSEGYSASILAALAAEDRMPFRVDIDNTLGVEMILVGLLAIAWDCRTRGGMGIRFREGTKHWRSIVLNAVINLRATWEDNVAHLPPAIETRDMRDTFAITVISIMSDIPMLQVAAGAVSVCGATIGPRQYADAKRRLKLWSKTDDAWTCMWQSARFLRQALWGERSVYSSWALFLTTLVCWGYHYSLTSSDRLLPSTDTPMASANALLDRILQAPGRLESLEPGLADLVSVVADHLAGNAGTGGAGAGASAGEIDKDNAALLWRLVGGPRGLATGPATVALAAIGGGPVGLPGAPGMGDPLLGGMGLSRRGTAWGL